MRALHAGWQQPDEAERSIVVEAEAEAEPTNPRNQGSRQEAYGAEYLENPRINHLELSERMCARIDFLPSRELAASRPATHHSRLKQTASDTRTDN